MRIPLPVTPCVVSRSMDAAHFNTIANHPDVRPWLGGEDPADTPIDLSGLIADPANLAFATPHGGFLAVALGSGRYDVHSLFLVEGRGSEAIHAQRDTAAYLFGATEATELRTTTPVGNPAAAALAKRAGFVKLFTSQIPWTAGQTLEADCGSLTLDRWALQAPLLRELGAWFHDALGAAKAALTLDPIPSHPTDPVHDAMVGTVVWLISHGTVEKAIRVYNIWAQCAHYRPIELLRRQPTILDIGDAVLEAGPTSLEVLVCR